MATLPQNIDEYLKIGQKYSVSDVHLAPCTVPKWRHNGKLSPIWKDSIELSPELTSKLVDGFISQEDKDYLYKNGDVDFTYETDFGRFRASVVNTRLGLEVVFRVINNVIKSMDELGLPDQLKTLLKYKTGLILVTGSVGSGKTTTLSSLINEINNDRKEHIITLEDPIETVFESRKSHVNQREIRKHTESFSTALRASLRQDPDVIMVGEMRDFETISMAITAAETGHLVLATLHTSTSSRTLDRILDAFPVEQREQIRVMLSESLRGVISQQLVPKKDGSGRVLALEILINNAAISSIIRDGKIFMIRGVLQTGKNVGMTTMDDSLLKFYREGLISKEELINRSIDSKTVKAEI